MIAVVVPTNREEKLEQFLKAWDEQFRKHQVILYVVKDGEEPTVHTKNYSKGYVVEYTATVDGVMGKKYKDLIYNFNDGVRNLGFAAAYKDGAEFILSLDDDTEPNGDTIGDHLNVLNSRKPISYMNSVEDVYMRGFPYWAREEAQVMFSHGLWEGVADFDASTQLVLGTKQPNLIKLPVPKGVLMPICVMNVMVHRDLIPYYYQAPMFGDMNRFADIYSGWEVKKIIDEKCWSMVNGYSTVIHKRASNPFINLIKEGKGLMLNEHYGSMDEDYFKFYKEKRDKWKYFLLNYASKPQ